MGARDARGLELAYAAPNNTFRQGETLYISGTHELRDVLDDTLIPFNAVHLSNRYAQAQDALAPGITTIVGHSLGAAVAARLAEQNPRLPARLYGAPRISWSSNANSRIKSVRRYGDPVSLLDRGASSSVGGFNPHSYDGF